MCTIEKANAELVIKLSGIDSSGDPTWLNLARYA